VSIQIEEGKFYVNRLGLLHGPMRRLDHSPCSVADCVWVEGHDVNPRANSWRVDGTWHSDRRAHDRDLVAQASAPVTDTHAVETVEGPQIADTPEWAKGVEAEAAEENAEDRFRRVCMETSDYGIIEEPKDLPRSTIDRILAEVRAVRYPDIKTTIADEAKRIVSGARRSAYGKPEQNFERIARFWDAYFKNTGRDISITAADVSPLMRLMKEARLCETPAHYDSHVDLAGYTLTGAEVNGVTKPLA